VDEILFSVLAENVGRHLDKVEQAVAHSEDLRRLVAAWRTLLDLHRPEGRRGRCTGCTESRQRAMCTVWRVANAFFTR
jgi:hypothetical protein